MSVEFSRLKPKLQSRNIQAELYVCECRECKNQFKFVPKLEKGECPLCHHDHINLIRAELVNVEISPLSAGRKELSEEEDTPLAPKWTLGDRLDI